MKVNILILLLVVALSFSCQQADYNKFRADNLNSGIYQSEKEIINPIEKWKFKTHGSLYASVVSDGAYVYVGSNDKFFYSINSETGELNWKFETEGEIRSTAVIDGENLYFLSYDGYLYNLKRKNGELVWKFKTEGDVTHQVKDYYNNEKIDIDFWDFFQSSPICYNNKVLFGAGFNFYCIDKNTGDIIWDFKTNGAVHSSPAIKDNKVYFGSFDSKVYCLEINNGNVVWDYQTGMDSVYLCWQGIQASPLIHEDKLYIGSRDALIYCFNSETGDTIWTNDNFERSWMPSSFSIADGKLYNGSSDGFAFYVINESSGKIIKKIDTKSYTFSSPALHGNMAYVGSANGRLYGINLKSEDICWEFKTEGAKTDTILIYNKTGEMDNVMLKKRMEELNIDNYKKFIKLNTYLFESVGSIVSSPIVSNGVIYFGSLDVYIYAISEE